MESKLIEDIHLFKELDSSDFEVIKGILKANEYGPEEVIFKEGEAGGSLAFIVKGRIRINKLTVEGDQICISTRNEGDMFGIMSFLDGSNHDATIVSDKKALIVTLKKADFDSLSQAHPHIANKILRRLSIHMAAILRDMNHQYMDLMHVMFRRSK